MRCCDPDEGAGGHEDGGHGEKEAVADFADAEKVDIDIRSHGDIPHERYLEKAGQEQERHKAWIFTHYDQLLHGL